MKPKKIWPVLTLTLGIGTTVVGVALMAAYVMEAVVARWGEPDQSLLFWYLPFLFFGILLVGGGIAATATGIMRLRKLGATTKGANPKRGRI